MIGQVTLLTVLGALLCHHPTLDTILSSPDLVVVRDPLLVKCLTSESLHSLHCTTLPGRPVNFAGVVLSGAETRPTMKLSLIVLKAYLACLLYLRSYSLSPSLLFSILFKQPKFDYLLARKRILNLSKLLSQVQKSKQVDVSKTFIT